MTDEVLVVLTNYSRPHNMVQVIKAWREQTAPTRVVVVDNSPPHPTHTSTALWIKDQSDFDAPVEAMSVSAGDYPIPLLKDADDVWRISTNLGPPCRFAPALALFEHRYTLFADDDFLPGREAVGACLDAAEDLGGMFATLGHWGRSLVGGQYRYGNVPRLSEECAPVDVTVRCHFVTTSSLWAVPRFREDLVETSGDRAAAVRLCGVHDDLLLCCGIQNFFNVPSYILPAAALDRQLIKEELPGSNGPEAVWKRKHHLEERNLFIRMASEVGWESIRDL